MFASRSDLMVRTKPRSWIAALSLLILMIAALLVQAQPARGASAPSKSRSKAVADSTARAGSEDEGISVRVIDGAKETVSKKSRMARHRAEAAKEDAGEVDEPDAPDTPDVPEPPDHDHDNDLVRFGQDIDIPEGKVVEGSVVAIGGSINVHGHVKGDCTAVGGSVSVLDSAVVEGDAVSVGGSTTVAENARVSGSNVSVGGWPLHGGHGAVLPLLGIMGGVALAGVFTTFIQLLLTILFAWLCLLLVRERLTFAVDRMSGDFGKSFLWGLVAWMAMIVLIPAIVIVGAIAMVILVITIIGIPVAILLAIAMVFALIGAVLGIIVFAFLGYLNGAMYLGRRIMARRSPGVGVTPIKAVIVGAILILGLKLLGNVLGFLGVIFVMPIGIALGIASAVLWIVFTTAGMGAMVLTRFAKGPPAFAAATAAPAAPAPPGAGWYSPPPTPPPTASGPSPEGGTSDAP